MRALRRFIKRLSNLAVRRRREEQLKEEIELHLALQTAENLRSGLSPAEARRQAILKFGAVEAIKEDYQAERSLPLIETLLQDIRYGLRTLGKSPEFSVVAILTLALGIGANTAVFSVVNSVLLSKLPVKDPQELVFLTNPDEQGLQVGFGDRDRDFLTYSEFQSLARNNQVFSGLLAASSSAIEISVKSGSGEAAPSKVSLVSGSYFSVLGVNPILGGAFTAEVDKLRDANPVAVISYRFWQERFGGAPDIIGRKIRILNTTYEVIGVAPPQFHGETVGANPEIWIPLTMQSEIFPGRDYLSLETQPFHKTEWLQSIGRLKPGISLAQAKASIDVEFQQMMQSQTGGMSPKDKLQFLNQYLPVAPGSRGASTLRANFGKPLQILMAVVGLILLITCANIANILLARSAARQKEISVRVALGARASRLFRQMLTEAILLAGIGGAVGLLLAHWADAALLRMVSDGAGQVPLVVHLDAKILAFTLGVSLLTGILFGLAPAFRATRLDVNSGLNGTSRSVAGSSARTGRVPIGKILVVAQVALSLLLLVVAGLFGRSFRNLSQVQLGYERDHLLQFSLNPLSYGYQQPEIPPLYKNILQRIGAIPGVRGVTLANHALMSGNDSSSAVSIEGQKPLLNDDAEPRWDMVAPNFFSVTGIPVLIGREITEQDSGNGQRVGVINQTMAQKFFPNSNPIGQRAIVHTTTEQADFVIVGVVSDSKHSSVREKPRPRFYIPYFNPIGDGWAARAVLIVRASGDPSSLTSATRAAVKETAATLPPVVIHTANQRIAESLATDRMITELSMAFGTLAIILVCIGLYGIMAYSVSRRTNEIGVRMALGAQRSNVLWLILRQSLQLVLTGVAIGVPLVFAAGKWISSLLFGVEPADPVALAMATLLMFLVGVLACYVPARSAMRVDPLVALHYE
jgi:predicted permease